MCYIYIYISPSWAAEIDRKATASTAVSRAESPISVKPQQENKHEPPVIDKSNIWFFIFNVFAAVIIFLQP